MRLQDRLPTEVEIAVDTLLSLMFVTVLLDHRCRWPNYSGWQRHDLLMVRWLLNHKLLLNNHHEVCDRDMPNRSQRFVGLGRRGGGRCGIGRKIDHGSRCDQELVRLWNDSFLFILLSLGPGFDDLDRRVCLGTTCRVDCILGRDP